MNKMNITQWIKLKYKYKPIVSKNKAREKLIKWQLRVCFDGDSDYDGDYWIKPVTEGVNSNQLGVKDIKVKETKHQIIINITLSRPGLFIGKSGRNYDAVVARLSEYFEKEIKINIIEYNPWS